MKPLSALYFIRENKIRCLLLMFMLFLGYGAYLGGVYVTNIDDNWKLPVEYSEKIVYVSSNSGDEKDFRNFEKEVADSGKLQFIELGSYNGINWINVMGFWTGNYDFTFRTVEDFMTYCEHMDINCDFSKLSSGSMIMSEQFAKNRGLKLGDKVDASIDENIYGEFTLNALTNENGYMAYFITDEADITYRGILLGNDLSSKELYEMAYGLQKNHDIYIQEREGIRLREILDEQFSTINLIYFFIVILMSLILAVTINAAFVGMYQQRNYEFAVYRAIGISKWRVIGKIAGELLCMDIIALTVGGAVLFLGLYLLNNLVLYPVGKYLAYFHPTALLGLVLCNMAVLIPLILTRCRQMLKADICEY